MKSYLIRNTSGCACAGHTSGFRQASSGHATSGHFWWRHIRLRTRTRSLPVSSPHSTTSNMTLSVPIYYSGPFLIHDLSPLWKICLRPVFLFVCLELAFVMLSNYIMFVVSCSNIRYDFRVKTMFDLPWISFVLHRVPVLFMLFVFIYVYWCPNLFPYQMMFVLFNKQRRFSHMEQELPTLPEHLSAPWGLVRFVWLDI
jgi:hypothetical protein